LQLSRDEKLRQQCFPKNTSRAAAGAREAITHYEVMAEYSAASARVSVTKLRLRLETGRKHQIRAQAAHAGLPLVGDRIYNRLIGDPSPPARASLSRGKPCTQKSSHSNIQTSGYPHELDWRISKDLRQLEGALRSGRL